MKSKILILLLAMVAVFTFTFGLTACGGSENQDSGNNNGQELTTPNDEEDDAEEELTPTEGLEYSAITEKSEIIAYSVSGIGTATDGHIVIPSTYNDKPVTAIDEWAFYECSSLTRITIPDSVKDIGGGAFIECRNLVKINLGKGVTTIGLSAFYYCKSLTSLTITNSVKTIGSSAFYGCTGLKSLTISESVTNIQPAAFAYCDNLTNIAVAAGNSKYHSSGNCIIETQSKTVITGCKSSVIPSDGSVTAIGDYAFADSSSLKSITIPKNVTSIGNYAFYCGSDAFEDNSNLTDIHYEGTKAQWEQIKKGNNWDEGTAEYTIHCTDGDLKK